MAGQGPTVIANRLGAWPPVKRPLLPLFRLLYLDQGKHETMAVAKLIFTCLHNYVSGKKIFPGLMCFIVSWVVAFWAQCLFLAAQIELGGEAIQSQITGSNQQIRAVYYCHAAVWPDLNGCSLHVDLLANAPNTDRTCLPRWQTCRRGQPACVERNKQWGAPI